jgi:hypothetical protein
MICDGVVDADVTHNARFTVSLSGNESGILTILPTWVRAWVSDFVAPSVPSLVFESTSASAGPASHSACAARM